MPLYESVFIARQDVSSAQVDTLADNFTKIITDNGGSVQKREYWGLRNLAYRMKKNRKGHYILFNIDAPPAAVHEMERNMRINEDVLRYMTLRVEALREDPSPVMQGRGERDRGDRFGDRGDRFDRGPRGEGRRGPRGDRDQGGESPADAEAPKRRPRAKTEAETESEDKGGES